MKRKLTTRLFLGALAVALVMVFSPTSSMAVSYGDWVDADDFEGSVEWSSGIFATGNWEATGTELSWDITEDSGLYTYEYSWATPTGSKELSHIIIELTTGTDIIDLIYNTPSIEGHSTGTFTADDQGASNPGIPSSIYGIKFDLAEDSTTFGFTFTSNQAPVWGNFYAKDGQMSGNDGEDVYAYNTGWELPTDYS
jgi:hypothetical protein